jgi:hypothetical protein
MIWDDRFDSRTADCELYHRAVQYRVEVPNKSQL